jgi:hypothetical protein
MAVVKQLHMHEKLDKTRQEPFWERAEDIPRVQTAENGGIGALYDGTSSNKSNDVGKQAEKRTEEFSSLEQRFPTCATQPSGGTSWSAGLNSRLMK